MYIIDGKEREDFDEKRPRRTHAEMVVRLARYSCETHPISRISFIYNCVLCIHASNGYLYQFLKVLRMRESEKAVRNCHRWREEVAKTSTQQ